MLNALLSIFRSEDPLREIGSKFAEMLKLTCEMALTAGEGFFEKTISQEERGEIYKKDLKVNQLERKIRKMAVAHLSIARNSPHLPYYLLLISLVKDVERLGDYAKNLNEVLDIYDGDLPDDEIVAELRQIRTNVEETFQASSQVFEKSDNERALELIHQGKNVARRADALVTRIAQSDYPSALATALALTTRYYKRFGGHLLNVLTSVVMPLHKVDYYDEDEIPKEEAHE